MSELNLKARKEIDNEDVQTQNPYEDEPVPSQKILKEDPEVSMINTDQSGADFAAEMSQVIEREQAEAKTEKVQSNG
jgi:hypothetical protein